MAVQGPIPVEFGQVFPRGVRGGWVRAGAGFRGVEGRAVRPVEGQETGLPLWVVDVIDADPQAREKTVRVKVAAVDQPVLPPAHAGMPFVAVEFAGLTVTPYVNQAGRLAFSLKATGVRAAGRNGRGTDAKDPAAA